MIVSYKSNFEELKLDKFDNQSNEENMYNTDKLKLIEQADHQTKLKSETINSNISLKPIKKDVRRKSKV